MTFRRLRFGLAAKFSFLISLPVLIASLALTYNFVKYSEKGIQKGMAERGKGIAKALSLMSEYGLLVEDRDSLNNNLTFILNREEILYALIRNASGEVLASYGDLTKSVHADAITDSMPADEQRDGLNYRMADTGSMQHVVCDVVTIQERRSREDIGLLQPDTASGRGSGKVKKIGTVQIGLSGADMAVQLRKAKLSAIFLTAVVIVLGILATVLITRAMVKPIRRLAMAAGEVSRGNFDRPVEVKSEDEIGDLAGSFNKMAADLKRSNEALQYRLEMERTIATVSTNFINLAPDEIDSGINHALQTIGEFAGVDRSYVFLFSDDGKKAGKTHGWCGEGIKPLTEDLRELYVESFPWELDKVNRFKIIHIPRVADLPPEASAVREIMQSQGTQSVVGVPMVYGGSLVGFLGLDSVRTGKTWTEEDITLLKMVGEIFVNALERKRAEEELQHRLEVGERIARELAEKTVELSRSNEELDAFVYTVSHDLKAPVVSLQGFSSLLMKEYEDRLDENGKMYIERIQKNSERMGILIENLLELSRIGRIKGQEELVNISDVISDVVNELVSQLEERGTRLIVEDQMPTIRCDCTRISQIFANLMSNANKFMGEDNEDPTIEVGYDDRDGYYRFYVKDNGVGIDEEYHAKIFQIFQRLNDVETEGTGVGLAIVKKIVESLGGKIWVDSAKGKGTTMYFTMPKAANSDKGADEVFGK